ncbi:thyroid receptor-interacting protein 11 isoform X2 [Diabrotica virgifera virgifera]|uniref:GRIP domain-containing protein n=1 Tax=Diabrotica virgifera virgifera TaxID=50390 RepID=A0ABM5L3P6_DIAVI|nr:thyroid receptor-interacting protein 11 isoform X2 [Diabrotica virgifera virgifera]
MLTLLTFSQRYLRDHKKNPPSQSSQAIQTQPHNASSNGSWNWAEDSSTTTPHDTISDLRKQIHVLENEKSELLGQLDQLDADNQENLANIMEMKEKLQFQLSDVKENLLKVKKDNKVLAAKEEALKKEVESLQRTEKGEHVEGDNEEVDQKSRELEEANRKLISELEDLKKEKVERLQHTEKAEHVEGHKEEVDQKFIELEEANRKLISEIEELKKEMSILQTSYQTVEKALEDTKTSGESNKNEHLKKLESENKLIYSELKKASEKISAFEKKSIEDEENVQKLAIILETYEEQVRFLKEELEKSRVDREQQLSALNIQVQQLTTEHSEDSNTIKQLEEIVEDNKKYISNLEKENTELKATTIDSSFVKALEDTVENQKKELENHILQKEELKKLNEDLLVKAAGRMDGDLESELEDIQTEHEAQISVLREELEQLRKEESRNIADTQKVENLEEEKLSLTRELKDSQELLQELKHNHEVALESLQQKYVNMITKSLEKFDKSDNILDYQTNLDEDSQELGSCINRIINTIKEQKSKYTELEKRLQDISEEKNTILAEKNEEIKNLLEKSDGLQQEVSANAQAAREFENECNELAKNNELLITELEAYKNHPGLQTISESNEDNMILLETQLENANRRIEDLEKIIDDLERSQMRKDSLEESGSDLENAVKQLSVTESEITSKQKEYQDLLNNFDQLQVEYESLKRELEEVKENLVFTDEENSELKSANEKLKTDNENMEYQLSELNINSDSMKDEIQEYKQKFKMILSENSNIKLQSDENLKKYLDFESKINVLEEKLASEEHDKKALESQVESITEKLKNAKMTETTLKLQLEQKNKELASQAEERYNIEIALDKTNRDVAEFQNNFVELQNQNDKLLIEQEQLRTLKDNDQQRIEELEHLVTDLEKQLEVAKTESVQKVQNVTEDISENIDYNNLKLMLDQTVLEKANLQAELNKLTQIQSQLKETTEKISVLQNQLQEITNSRNELINMVTMKHQENVTYHNEIQKLNQVLIAEAEKYKNLEVQLKAAVSPEDIEAKNNEIEKLTDQNSFLKEKCEVLAKNLLEEQAQTQKLLAERSVPSEKETSLQKKVDRLQAHLIELEEHYTQELLQAEQKNASLKAKVADIEEREKSSSTMYTSVSIRANQQVESLQSQLHTAIAERDSLRKQISDAEDENTKQAAALANLQFVLEQFRKDKEQDVIRETDRIRRHINTEKQVQEDLRKEITNLQAQLEERNQGLLAASRLSDQLESSKKTVVGLKDEVSQLQTKLSKTEEELSNALSSTDGKVDKLLIKNLILGFVTTNNNLNRDQTQILKIIATVLDFNQQEHDKIKLNKPQQGWLSSLLAPNPDQNKMTEESLSRAFIQFLENESKPRVVPSLLDTNTPTPSNSSTKTTNSRAPTPKQTPIVLSEIVLPTFSDFAQNRNSSSILKDVLKDNS